MPDRVLYTPSVIVAIITISMIFFLNKKWLGDSIFTIILSNLIGNTG